MGSSFKEFGLGLAGGAVYQLAKSFLGNGILATLAAPLLAGSVIKGNEGMVISTVAGFEAAQSLGLFSGGSSSGGSNSRGEM